jgi:hypothetical protein
MLHKVSKLHGVKVRGTDDDLGEVADLYFDDRRWTIRYLSVKTGSWLDGRTVLISPMSVERRWTIAKLPVRLTREQLRQSPDAERHEPLSRKEEQRLLDHYGHPAYWGDSGLWGPFGDPAALGTAPSRSPASAPASPLSDNGQSLRRISEVMGFHIEARDGEIGHVDDFLIDEDSWGIRYLVIDTSNWIGGKSVAVAPRVLEGIDWTNKKVEVSVARDVVKNAPLLKSMDVPPAEDMAPFTFI